MAYHTETHTHVQPTVIRVSERERAKSFGKNVKRQSFSRTVVARRMKSMNEEKR